jgi:predicted lipoprotein with Yx(FWY)xxD motif
MHVKRLTILFILAAASLPLATPQAATRGHDARAAKLRLRHTTVGSILVNGRGFTVFAFTRDSRNHDRCAAISGCTSIWPLVTTRGTPTVGPGVRRRLVGAIELAGGQRQVTYAGHPLYTYIADSGPGDTSYVGVSQFGGRWLALTAAGHTVK